MRMPTLQRVDQVNRVRLPQSRPSGHEGQNALIEPDGAELLHARFAEQAKRTPSSIALRHQDQSITFAELDLRSDRVAGLLRSRGIPDCATIGVHMERSIDYVAAVLAILKSNCAVMPLPPTYPEGRLREILSFAGLDAVIDDQVTPLDPALGAAQVLRFSEAAAYAPVPPGLNIASSHQPAFVLCSSGSTGRPKLIVRSHRSFFHRLNWTWTNHPYSEGEVCCQKSHMTTTHATYELFEPLLRGVPVLIVSDSDVRDLERFWDAMRDGAVSRLLIVPSMLQASLDLPGFVAPPVKVLILMGEHVTSKLAAKATECFPQETSIYSIYGSTEASSTLVCDIRKSFRMDAELPLGTPISSGISAVVLDVDLQPVPAGQMGLLHIAGPALFQGYYNDPELTRSVLVTSPVDGATLYNTKDQVRALGDGSIEFVGRIDHTVKIRGFRVDLQEIERALLMHPQVTQATVMPVGDRGQNSALAAFYTPATVDRTEVDRFLRDRLPGYMIPSVLFGVDAFPRTASGKTDRQALLQLYASPRATDAPDGRCSGTQSKVARVFESVLKHGNLGPDTGFFDAGGTSLTVFSLVHQLRDAFGLDRDQISQRSVYEHPTIERLASHIDALHSGAATPRSATNTILSTLRKAQDASLPPLFVIASAGGTLGAYEKLVKFLRTNREVIGVRDPFVWGDRDPTAGFGHWVDLYLAAIRQRQPHGPYHLVAYSSAGAFGYEIARRLRHDGEDVALLALIDPLGIDSGSNQRFSYWVSRAVFQSTLRKRAVIALGWLRSLMPQFRHTETATEKDDDALTKSEFGQLAEQSRRNRNQISSLAALLELNSGRPFALSEDELSRVGPEQYLSVLLAKVKRTAPEIDPAAIEKILIQYHCLQIPAQRAYRLRAYDGAVLVFEPEGPNRGLFRALFQQHAKRLQTIALPLGAVSDRTSAFIQNLSPTLRSHYLSMRDDEFVRQLAEHLEVALRITTLL